LFSSYKAALFVDTELSTSASVLTTTTSSLLGAGIMMDHVINATFFATSSSLDAFLLVL